MNDQPRYRLGEFLEGGEDCAFLSLEEIDALAEGRLAGDRLAEFESHQAQCERCQVLARDLELFEELTEGDGPTRAERRALESFRSPRSLWRRRWPFGLAAAAAVIAAVFLFVPLRNTEPMVASPELPVFLPPPALRGASIREVWTSSAEAWERGDLRAAIGHLEEGVAIEPRSTDLRFYLGVARLFDGQPAEAADALESAIALRPEDPSESALWYAAIAYDRLGRHEEACGALERVSSLGGRYAHRASALFESHCGT